MVQVNNNQTKKSFDYCLWAKLLVGFPTVFIIVMAVAGMFDNPLFQMLGGAAAGVAVVYVAMLLDRIPFLQKKVYTPKSE